MNWLISLFKKKPPEKIRIRFRNGQMVGGSCIKIPADIANNHIKLGMFGQWLYNYELHINQQIK